MTRLSTIARSVSVHYRRYQSFAHSGTLQGSLLALLSLYGRLTLLLMPLVLSLTYITCAARSVRVATQPDEMKPPAQASQYTSSCSLTDDLHSLSARDSRLQAKIFAMSSGRRKTGMLLPRPFLQSRSPPPTTRKTNSIVHQTKSRNSKKARSLAKKQDLVR